MTRNLLEVKNLSVNLSKNNKSILKDINFNIEPNCTLGIIGESGSGKTITSKALLGLLNPSVFKVNGQILLQNQEITSLNNKQMNKIRGRKIAMIMQNPMTAFAPMLRIQKQIVDTLTYHLKISKKEAYNTSLEEMSRINLVDTRKIMNSYPHELSGGMLQRVMIALTLLLEPKIIIADEATTAVDVISESLILEELMKVKQKGVSLLVVTHDLGVAATLADKIIVMRNGEIIEKGKTNKILASPEHCYTKQLLEASILTKRGEDFVSDKKCFKVL